MDIGIGIGIDSVIGGGVSSVQNFNVTLVDTDGVDETYAHITWTASSKYETEIWRSLDGGAFALLTTIGLNIGEYNDQLFDGNEHTVQYYARFKQDTTVLNAPIISSVSVVAGKVRIIWDDNNTEAEFIEIYASIDSGAYSLITTVAQGTETYDHTVTFDTNISYKLRAKEGTLPVYSSYSSISTYDPAFSTEAKAVFTKVTSLSSTMALKNKLLMDTYIKAQKTAGLWALTYADWWMLEGSVNGKINIKSPNDNYLTEYGVGSPLTWTANDGVVGTVGQNRGIDSNWNPVTASINVNSFAAHWYGKTNQTTGALFGYYVTPYITFEKVTGVYAMCNGTLTVVPAGVDTTESGCLERSASNREDIYRNGVSVANNVKNAGALPNVNLYILNSLANATKPSNAKLSHFAFTTKFTAQQHIDWVANELAYINGLV